MKFLPVFALLSTVWVVSASLASLPNGINPTNATENPDAPKAACDCQGTLLYRDDVIGAWRAGIDASHHHAVGGYPMPFDNDEGFVFPGCQGPYEEYPVLQGGVYTQHSQNDAGPHRVVYEFGGSKSVYCGCVTHENAPRVKGKGHRKGYLQCT
ncbi:hypothetical protein BD311DRAFT_106241 [Dichomitus squalens]|uniref:Uncharacterized protein n=1 Tax=Dichomitus squalens TaxID=114155 RepID=A0A4Q9MAZ2_9APHY|nr:hypothetical protein BD311DRAFT_106241 [Dichomitus squalens]